MSARIPPVPLTLALRRGLRLRCPRCGEGRLFEGWNRLNESCPVCGLVYERENGDTWFFMYMTTAGLTGMLVVTMFLLRPRVVWLGQLAIGVAALVLIVSSLPFRKGIAVALNYLIQREGA
ncbi:MAG TPA: DUF983 domain-containing protein [Thermoanaerobaculia bacterium]